MNWYTVAALLKLDTADILFLTVAILFGVVLVLLSNPLTSWVSRMLGKDKHSPSDKG